MTTRNSAIALLGLASVTIFAYRDAVGSLCSPERNGCVTNVIVPCSGSAACASTAGDVPGGLKTCTDMTAATFWTATPPTDWPDCIHWLGQGSCTRVGAVCETVRLFETMADCSRNIRHYLTA